MFLLRLDDACDYMDVKKWSKMETLLDKYNIKPLVGIIPDCKYELFCSSYNKDMSFWAKAKKWEEKGWGLALHGHQHIYMCKDGGINPYVQNSEFAGLPLEIQKDKIKTGYSILLENGIHPVAFFAPSHTFDDNTVLAIKEETDIRVICDTQATNIYKEGDIFFYPVVSNCVRKLPFKYQTFCYHPNTMSDNDFDILENFFIKYSSDFVAFSEIPRINRKRNWLDNLLKTAYFTLRKFRKIK